MRQPNLDEVFLSLTGRPTEDSGSMAATRRLAENRKERSKNDNRHRPRRRGREDRGSPGAPLTVTRRALLRYVRTPQLIVLATVQMSLFFLIYRYMFGGAIHIAGMSYVDYLVPGLHRHRRAVHGDRDGHRDGRGPRAGIRRPVAVAADPALVGSDRACGGGHDDPRVGHCLHRGGRVRGRLHAPRLGARRDSRRSGWWCCSGSRSSGCSSRWVCSPATRRRLRGWG